MEEGAFGHAEPQPAVTGDGGGDVFKRRTYQPSGQVEFRLASVRWGIAHIVVGDGRSVV